MKFVLPLLVLLPILCACAAHDPARSEPGGTPGADASPDTPARPITDVEWRLVELGGEALVPNAGPRVPFLRFDAESSMVHGHGGVNSFFCPYALDGATLRVESLGSTRMAGQPQAMEQESAFLAAIEAARSVRMDGDELALLDGTGRSVARLARVAR